MGEELKSPFIDSICSVARPTSQLGPDVLENSKEKDKKSTLKETFDKILQRFDYLLPSHKQISHGILDAIYLFGQDVLIGLCYENRILRYEIEVNLVNEAKLPIEIFSLSASADESLVLALGLGEILFINSNTLEVLRKVTLDDVVTAKPFEMSLHLLTTSTEIFLLNLEKASKKNVLSGLNLISSIDYNNQKLLILLSDADGIRTYHKDFVMQNFFKIGGILRVKFSDKVVAILKNEILLFSDDLEILRKIYTFQLVSDVILQEIPQILSCSNSQGEIFIYDLRTDKRKICIPVQNYQIVKIFLRHKQIVVAGNDSKISILRIPKLHNLFINKTPVLALSTTNNYSSLIYITEDSEVKLWNYKEEITISILKAPDLSPCISFFDGKAYLSSLENVFEIDINSLQSEKIEKSPEIRYTATTICRNILVCIGKSQLLYLYNINPVKLHSQVSGHDSIITCISSYRQYLLTGSHDSTVRIWNFRKIQLIHVLSHHQMKVNSVVADNGKVISGSDDRSIKISYIKTGELIFSLENIIGSVKKLFFSGEFLVSCGLTGKITYWNLQTYSEIATVNTLGKISDLAVNEKVLAYNTGKGLKVMRNPLFTEKLVAIGSDESLTYSFMTYCVSLIRNEFSEHNAQMDKWVIFPYFLTPLHLYAYFNHSDSITTALNNGAVLLQSRLQQSPLSIAVARDLETCVEAILKSLRTQLQKNPYLLGFMTHTSLIEMNQTSHISLPKFYSLIFREVYSEKLPRFIGYNLALPVSAHSYNMTPTYQIFFHEKYIKDTGQPVVFTRSVIKLNLELGSSESLSLLKSITECKNTEILGTSFISAYVRDKWDIVKWFMWIQFVVYFSYLTLLCVYMLHFYEDALFLMLPFSTSVLLAVYEIYKAMVSRKEYLQDLMNYVDVVRALLFFVYAFGIILRGSSRRTNSQSHKVDEVNNTLLFLTLLSFIRGLSYFRIFESTRHFTHMIYLVILESRAFSIIMFYSTVMTAFLLYIVFDFEEEFSIYLGNSFLIDIQYLDPTYFGKTQWAVYAFSLSINCFVLLNVLISIYYNTILVVIAGVEIANCRALAYMCLEAERNMFWKRNYKKNHYLGICEKEYSEGDADPVLTKIKEVKNYIKDMQGQISQFLEAKKDFEKVLKINQKILRTFPKKKISQAEKDKNALLMLASLIKAGTTENRDEKTAEIKKINKILAGFKN